MNGRRRHPATKFIDEVGYLPARHTGRSGPSSGFEYVVLSDSVLDPLDVLAPRMHHLSPLEGANSIEAKGGLEIHAVAAL